MIKFEYSNSYQAKYNRIKRLPEFLGNAVKGAIKKDMIGIIKTFHDGIKNDEFGLKRLLQATINQKERKGFTQTDTPLYGKGDEEELRSYCNMLRIRELKNGYKIYPSQAYHWSKRVKLIALFYVHEFGMKIVTNTGSIIQIPPRPAFRKAYEKYLSEKSKEAKEKSLSVKMAIAMFINQSNLTYMNKLIQQNGLRQDITE